MQQDMTPDGLFLNDEGDVLVTSTRSSPSPRINDLAAPPEPVHPVVYLEPVVAFLILANGVMIGFQTSPGFELWEAHENKLNIPKTPFKMWGGKTLNNILNHKYMCFSSWHHELKKHIYIYIIILIFLFYVYIYIYFQHICIYIIYINNIDDNIMIHNDTHVEQYVCCVVVLLSFLQSRHNRDCRGGSTLRSSSPPVFFLRWESACGCCDAQTIGVELWHRVRAVRVPIFPYFK